MSFKCLGPSSLEDAIKWAEAQNKTIPNELCWEAFLKVKNRLIELGIIPERTVPDADGGFSLFWFPAADNDLRRYSSISVDNDGDTVCCVVYKDKVIAWDISELSKTDLARMELES